MWRAAYEARWLQQGRHSEVCAGILLLIQQKRQRPEEAVGMAGQRPQGLSSPQKAFSHIQSPLNSRRGGPIPDALQHPLSLQGQRRQRVQTILLEINSMPRNTGHGKIPLRGRLFKGIRGMRSQAGGGTWFKYMLFFFFFLMAGSTRLKGNSRLP